MSRLLGFLLFSLFVSQSTAQNKFASIPDLSAKARTYSYSNEGKLIYFIRDKKILHVLVYDTAFTLLKQVRYNLEDFIDKSEGVLGVTEINKMPSLFFGDKRLASFSSISLDIGTYDVLQHSYPVLPNEQYYLNSFSANGKFYVVCFTDKEPSGLILKEYKGDGSVTDHLISLVDLPLNLGYFEQVNQLFYEIDVSSLKKIRWDAPNNNITAGAWSKFYVHNNQLLITLNNVPDTTQIISIDLDTYQKKFRKIPSGNFVSKKDRRLNDNSFLIDDKLFYVAACREQLLLKVLDFETGATLQQFATNKEEEIKYRNGAFCKTLNNKESEPEFDTKKMLDKFCDKSADAKLGVGVSYSEHGDYEVTIGNSRTTNTNYPFIMPYFFNPPPPLSGPPGFGAAWILLLSLLWAEGLPNKSVAYENYYFKTHLNKSDLSYVKRSVVPSQYDKLNLKVEELKDSEVVIAISKIRFNGNLVLSYYNTESQNFYTSVFGPEK
ncbi:MAG: hypothetical protein V4615_10010 [Bacteroidota bacterium]